MTRRSRGMTLVELLVVLALLAAVAGSALTLTDSADRRGRYEDTVKRLAVVREASVGSDIVGPTGLLTGGYLQDVGWLPSEAADLLRKPAAVEPRTYSATWRTWSGWAGPYLAAPPMRRADTTPALYDGWGRDFHGFPGGTPWTLPLFGGDFAPRSRGADGKVDTGAETDSYDLDWPKTAEPLVPAIEWATDLSQWPITIVNRTGAAITFPAGVRWRVVVPRWDHGNELGFWPVDASDRDAWEHYGAAAIPSIPQVDADGTLTVGTFGDGTNPRRVPNGRRVLFLVQESNGQPAFASVLSTPVRAASVYAEIDLSRKLAPHEIRVEVR